jgi:trigger factor
VVEQGDVLIAETSVALEGDADPAPPRRQLVQMGNNIPGYDEALVGMKIGEEKKFTLTYPDDFDDESRRGQSAEFTVKVSSISAKRLPELNEDFAKDAGGVETVKELREVVLQRLNSEAERISNEIAEQRIIEKVLEKSEVHFPAALVREEVEEKLRQLSGSLRQHNMSYQTYLSQTGLTQEQHQAGLFMEAEGQIRSLLALREIAKQESMNAPEEAIDAEFARLAETGAITTEAAEEFSAEPRRRFQIANALIQQRLHEFLFNNNTLVEVKQASAPPEE